jgi:hypothetical protein
LAAAENLSWDIAIQAAANLDPPRRPISTGIRIPSRLIGFYALIFMDGEWELAKIESIADGLHGSSYRYKMNWSYGTHAFSTNLHGRDIESIRKWVLLK